MKLINSLALMAALFPKRSAAFVPLRALTTSTHRWATTTTTTTSQAGGGPLRAGASADDDDEYDLVVIGGGSGGVRASRISAGYGKKVAILEPQLNHGAPNYSAIGGTVRLFCFFFFFLMLFVVHIAKLVGVPAASQKMNMVYHGRVPISVLFQLWI